MRFEGEECLTFAALVEQLQLGEGWRCGSNGDSGARTDVSSAEIIFVFPRVRIAFFKYIHTGVWCKLVCGSNGDFGARTNVSSAEILFDIVLPRVYLDRPQSLYYSFLRNRTAKLDWL